MKFNALKIKALVASSLTQPFSAHDWLTVNPAKISELATLLTCQKKKQLKTSHAPIVKNVLEAEMGCGNIPKNITVMKWKIMAIKFAVTSAQKSKRL